MTAPSGSCSWCRRGNHGTCTGRRAVVNRDQVKAGDPVESHKELCACSRNGHR